MACRWYRHVCITVESVTALKYRFVLWLSRLFCRYGGFVFDNAVAFIVVSLCSCLLLGVGFLYKQTEFQMYKLYSLPDTPSQMAKTTLLSTFTPERIAYIFVTSDSKHLSKPTLLMLDELNRRIANITVSKDSVTADEFGNPLNLSDPLLSSIPENISYWDVCLKDSTGSCSSPSIMSAYFSPLLYGRDIVSRDYPTVVNIRTKQAFRLDSLLGNITKQTVMQGGRDLTVIKNATAFSLRHDFTGIDGWVHYSAAFETKLLEVVRAANIEGMKITVRTERSINDELSRSSRMDFADKVRLGIAICFVVVYSVISNTSCSYRNKTWVSLMGVVAALMGYIGGTGMLHLFGLLHTPPAEATPFLVIGIGVDDVFVMLNAYSLTYPLKRSRDRIRMAMRDAGISITITTMTSIIAFIIGAVSPYFSISRFCIITAVSLFMGYVMCLTFFLGWLAIDARREERGDWCYCKRRHTKEDRKSSLRDKSRVESVDKEDRENVVTEEVVMREIGTKTRQLKRLGVFFFMSGKRKLRAQSVDNRREVGNDGWGVKEDEVDVGAGDETAMVVSYAKRFMTTQNSDLTLSSTVLSPCRSGYNSSDYASNTNSMPEIKPEFFVSKCQLQSTMSFGNYLPLPATGSHPNNYPLSLLHSNRPPSSSDLHGLALSQPYVRGRLDIIDASRDWSTYELVATQLMRVYVRRRQEVYKCNRSAADVEGTSVSGVWKRLTNRSSRRGGNARHKQGVVLFEGKKQVGEEEVDGENGEETANQGEVVKQGECTDKEDIEGVEGVLPAFDTIGSYDISVTVQRLLQYDQGDCNVNDSDDFAVENDIDNRIERSRVGSSGSSDNGMSFRGDNNNDNTDGALRKQLTAPSSPGVDIDDLLSKPDGDVTEVSIASDGFPFWNEETILKEPAGNVGNLFRRFFLCKYGQWLSLWWVKVLVLLVFTAYMGGAIWGLRNLNTGLSMTDITPDRSYLREFYNARDLYFTEYGEEVVVFFPYVENWHSKQLQDEFMRLRKRVKASEYCVFMVDGLGEFLEDRGDKLIAWDKQQFTSELKDWLAKDAVGRRFRSHFKFSLEGDNLLAWKFYYWMPFIDNTRISHYWLDDVKQIVKESEPLFRGVAFTPLSIMWESDPRILDYTITNMGIALAAIVFVATLLIPDVLSAVLVIAMIVMVDVGLFGYMTFWNLELNMLTMVNLLISIGFSVDYTAHMVHTFTHCVGPTRTHRMIETLVIMGNPVTHGMISTILSVLALCTADKYALVVFFQMMTMVLVFAYAHGVVLLPVILSIIGPMPRKESRTPRMCSPSLCELTATAGHR